LLQVRKKHFYKYYFAADQDYNPGPSELEAQCNIEKRGCISISEAGFEPAIQMFWHSIIIYPLEHHY